MKDYRWVMRALVTSAITYVICHISIVLALESPEDAKEILNKLFPVFTMIIGFYFGKQSNGTPQVPKPGE